MPDITGGLTVTNLPSDPATGTKQDAGNALLTAIAASVDGLEAGIGSPSDAPASSELQAAGTLAVLRGLWVELRGVGERLAMLALAITRPVWFDPSTGALRITGSNQTLTTVTTVTTLTTLTNQSQVGGVDAKTSYVDIIMRENWANSIGNKIV